MNGSWVGVPRDDLPPSPYPFGYVADAAFADLTKWLDDGTPPPRAARIQVTDMRAGTSARDRFGNALGGLRTPFVDVPAATYSRPTPVAHDTDLSGLCLLIGFSIPFGHATLHALYPSHADYVARVTREADELVRQGFWVAVRCRTGRAAGRARCACRSRVADSAQEMRRGRPRYGGLTFLGMDRDWDQHVVEIRLGRGGTGGRSARPDMPLRHWSSTRGDVCLVPQSSWSATSVRCRSRITCLTASSR